jgi:hypothetical protein
MYYKEDWHKSKVRLKALWENEIIDRCCISVVAPRDKRDPSFKYAEHKGLYNLGAMLTSKYMNDPAKVLLEKTRIFENVYFGGEAFPQIWMNYGPAGHAGYFGCNYHVGKVTTWFEPFLKDWVKDQIIFREDNEILQYQLQTAKYLVQEGKGKFFISTPDNSGCLDALASIRGTEELLVDLVFEEEQVKIALRRIIEVWGKVNDSLFEITKECNEGGSTIGWLSIWAPGKFAQLQSDISVMLSNDMFEKYVKPELEESLKWLDYSLYHLDGQAQLRHLEDLLALSHLNMIQWVSVAGEPSYMKFIPVFQKIQAAGKGLLINDVKINDVEKLLSYLSPKGLLIMTQAENESDAKELLKKTEKWSCCK